MYTVCMLIAQMSSQAACGRTTNCEASFVTSVWIHWPTMHITFYATLCTGMNTYESLVVEHRQQCQWSVARQQPDLYILLIRAAEGLHRLQQVSVAQVQHCQLILQTQQHRSHLLPVCKPLPFINRVFSLGECMMHQV